MAAPFTQASRTFEYVREWGDEFLSLFPHRGDYIYAKYPEPGKRPNWKTESRHLLSDRLIQGGNYLYGVRFGAYTRYVMLDIDKNSIYHPRRDPFAISRIVAVLEQLGLVNYVAITSSYSGGIHLYFPFHEQQKTWDLAFAVETLLISAGYSPTLGQLELYPAPKAYRSDSPSLYNAHRLPMQVGSYLLNEQWETTYSSQTAFAKEWQFAQQRNDVNSSTLQQVVRRACRRRYSVTGKAAKFLDDLDADIEVGWTDYGQTNRLLGRIAMREYVFGHVLRGGSPLNGTELVNAIVQVACALPGYTDWCRHQHEIEDRATDWAKAIESSHYYPYGSARLKALIDKQGQPTWNEIQAEGARERIRAAIADLLEKGCLPAQVTARRNAIRAYKVGNTTLDKNLDLWHPDYIQPLTDQEYHPVPSTDSAECLNSAQEEQYQSIELISLDGWVGICAPSEQQILSPRLYVPNGGSGGFSTGQEISPIHCSSAQDISKLCHLIREQDRLAKIEKTLLTSSESLNPPDEKYFSLGQEDYGPD